MPIASSLRFRFFLDLGKKAIYVVDGVSTRWAPLRRLRGIVEMEIPEIGGAVLLRSGNRTLAGWFVAPEGPAWCSVLLCHGIGDRIVYWRRAQQRLAEAGICSLVFHYSGYRPSEGATTPENLAQDAHAAYAWLRDRVPAPTPAFVLGFSLGSGLAADVAGALDPPPAGLILAEAFTSLREAAGQVVRPVAPLSRLLPNVWRTCESVGRLKMPILFIHSRAEELFPPAMAERIYASAKAGGAPAELVLLDGHRHNAPYLAVPQDYWGEIVAFLRRTAGAAEGSANGR
jgi:fermentation-respiration switch protein FrsA (DUF1100 family)